MAETKYRLVMHTGPTPGKVIPLEKNELSIGRELTNDIVIPDAEISRRHARLIRQNGGYVIEDLGSTNGTFINGQRLNSPYVLRPGETITLGERVSLAYEAESFDPDATLVGTQSIEETPVPPAEVTPSPPPENISPQFEQEPYAAQVPRQEPAPIPPPPPFSGQGARGPINVEPPPERRRGLPTWLIIIIILIVLVLCVCVVGGVLIDRSNSWCTLFPFLPGCVP